MKKMMSLLLGSIIVTTFAMSESHTIHWGYSGHGGPEYWGELSDDFKICMIGRNQSPIDIVVEKSFETDLPDIVFNYRSAALDVVDNGHTEQVDINHGSYILLDGIKFELKQFHFHTPSENRIDGKSFPLEAHFVHADEHGNLAVVALMFSYGAENPVLKRIWSKLPERVGEKKHCSLSADEIMQLLPKDKAYYRFNGSLTTPPCSEGVRWLVIKQPVTISKAQVQKFAKIMHHANNRPVQPINARVILK
ncbi:carbonic anhydrase [Hydrogenimonas cancrithermarum]|uniref:Carbonic anhydrase n=1 Tax=Hydrogenimonas cancrithermarum TaxID=2993563 RepID=A0ABM8FL81_9BACT|nr:carbonic anhydrase family protein [Hydrogenimonas cancrithermarum]BDY12160.1 carbonic anhydrase [Hydrogenimonas cancrithermarum]